MCTRIFSSCLRFFSVTFFMIKKKYTYLSLKNNCMKLIMKKSSIFPMTYHLAFLYWQKLARMKLFIHEYLLHVLKNMTSLIHPKCSTTFFSELTSCQIPTNFILAMTYILKHSKTEVLICFY